ncbi:unnamed protein product [Soboliphyme baturini]|uniref:MFS domain-containing protein n=1 Tax=Soboliphyme baturini TaxID=241478 RepID=A0A183J0Z0_9BILA|nr:unnamed protein product [Soboliphyme baturini]
MVGYLNDAVKKPHGLAKFLRSLSFQMSIFLCGAMYCTMFSNLNLSVTILAMVNTTFTGCRYVPGMVLSAISWGRILAPTLGPLVDRSDARLILPISLVVAAFASAAIPVSTKVGPGLVMFLRMLIGVADATINPTTSKLLSQQFTPAARINALSWTTAGRQLGTLTVYPLAAYISDNHGEESDNNGWPMVFYICAAVSMCFVLLWIGFTMCRRKKMDKKIST